MLSRQRGARRWVILMAGGLTCVGLEGRLMERPAIAQILPDDTQGSESSQVENNGLVRGLPAVVITGGARRGDGVFHSFSEFNVGSGQRVYFANPEGATNIFSRVIGRNLSNILGTLGVNGSANLFFLNPNGVVFGPNARLDLQGSFLATTADRFVFPNQVTFGATNPQAPPLLNLNVPIGLQYGTAPGAIASRGRLTVPPGQSLILAGGSITLSNSDLIAPGGRIELMGVGGGFAGLRTEGNRLSLNLSSNSTRADISLTNASLNVIAQGGGDVELYGRNISITSDRIRTVIWGGIRETGDRSNRAGDIILNATGRIQLTASRLINELSQRAVGNSGDIRLVADSIAVNDGSAVRTNTNSGSQGNAGNIWIEARSFSASNGSLILSNSFGSGNTGNITFKILGTLSLSRGDLDYSSIQSVIVNTDRRNGGSNSSQADSAVNQRIGGTINIQAGSLVLSGASSVVAETEAQESIGGNILIRAGDVQLRDGAIISTSTSGGGSGGNITLTVDRSLNLIGIDSSDRSSPGEVNLDATSRDFIARSSRILALTGGRGHAGTIRIRAGQITMNDGAIITSASFGLDSLTRQEFFDRRRAQGYIFGVREELGQGGDIFIRADSINLSGTASGVELPLPTRIATSTSSTGNAGNLTLNTRRLTIQNGALISTSTLGRFRGAGSSGALTVNASEFINLVGASTSLYLIPSALSTDTFGPGQVGDLRIQTPRLTIRDGAVVSASTFGSARSGRMSVNAAQIEMSGTASPQTTFDLPSGLYAQTFDSGRAGDISINATHINLNDEATITAASNNLRRSRIPEDFLRAVGFPGIFPTGNGGEISITANTLSLNNQSTIRASTISSRGGNISLRGLERLQVNQSLITASTTTGQAGNLTVNANALLLDGGSIAASTNTGTAGNLTVNANTMLLDGNSTIATRSDTTGTAGSLAVTAAQLSIQNGSSLTVTSPSGLAGDLTVNIGNLSLDAGSITASTSTGRAGDVTVNAETIALNRNASIAAEAVNADSVSDNGTVAIAPQSSTGGIAGNLTVTARQISVQNGSRFTVSSLEGRAGNLTVETNQLFLNRGAITALTGVSGGESVANIRLQNLDWLLLRNGSGISATAGANANGGNILIDSSFIISVLNEANKISANALEGRGGNIEIFTQGLLGIRPAAFPGDEVSDITASSARGIQGNISIRRPDVDPTRGLSQLPANVIDATDQIGQVCPTADRAAATESNEFVVSGRGGLPPGPTQPLNGEEVLADWIAPDPQYSTSQSDHPQPDPVATSVLTGEARHDPAVVAASPTVPEIVEAQGWVRGADGRVYIVASQPEISVIPSVTAPCP